MEKNSKIIAIAAVVVIVIAAAAVIIMGNSGDEEPAPEPELVTITDSLGNKVEVMTPVTAFCTVNTNAAEFFKILGIEDTIKCADNQTISMLSSIYGNVKDVGEYKAPAGDIIVDSGCKVLISQSSSRSLSSATEQALMDNYGIQVLRLDFYGETMQQDVQQLLSIVRSSSAQKAYDSYIGEYNKVKNDVLSISSKVSGDPSFLMVFTSMKAYYNHNSELGKIVQSVHGHNALDDMGVDPGTGVSNKPDASTVLDYDNTTGIDYLFIRSVDSSTLMGAYNSFVKNMGGAYDFTKLSPVLNGKAFVIESDVMSGPRDYIGYVCIAEAFGIDTGYDALKLVNDFNEKYGLPTYDEVMIQITA